MPAAARAHTSVTPSASGHGPAASAAAGYGKVPLSPATASPTPISARSAEKTTTESSRTCGSRLDSVMSATTTAPALAGTGPEPIDVASSAVSASASERAGSASPTA